MCYLLSHFVILAGGVFHGLVFDITDGPAVLLTLFLQDKAMTLDRMTNQSRVTAAAMFEIESCVQRLKQPAFCKHGASKTLGFDQWFPNFFLSRRILEKTEIIWRTSNI